MSDNLSLSIFLGSRSGVYVLGTPVDESVIVRQATVDDIADMDRFEMQPFAVLVPGGDIESKEEFPALGDGPIPEGLVKKTCFASVEVCDGDFVLVAIKRTAAFYVHISRVFIMNAGPSNMLMSSHTNVHAIFQHGY